MFEFMDNKDYNMGLARNKISRRCVDRKKGKYVEKVRRPIDQKCTADVITCVAAGIIDFVDNDNQLFCVNDIWKSDYMSEYVIRYFRKPDPKTKAKNEYDKFFSQPINMFEYAGIIKYMGHLKGKGKNDYYKIVEMETLQFLAQNSQNSYEFLVVYLKKLVRDSHLESIFSEFLQKQTNDSYASLRKGFYAYLKKKTNIENEKEKGRIFTKVLNVLALDQNKKGTVKGRMSKRPIDFSEILYNRENWRFVNSSKSKSITRDEFEVAVTAENEFINSLNIDFSKTSMNRAMNRLREYNRKVRGGKPESSYEARNDMAKYAHHIFPKNEFIPIRACMENLIMLSAHQHDDLAHLDNKKYINKQSQKRFILDKIDRIEENLQSAEDDIYIFSKLLTVLNIGLRTEQFSGIENNDFDSVRAIINSMEWR